MFMGGIPTIKKWVGYDIAIPTLYHPLLLNPKRTPHELNPIPWTMWNRYVPPKTFSHRPETRGWLLMFTLKIGSIWQHPKFTMFTMFYNESSPSYSWAGFQFAHSSSEGIHVSLLGCLLEWWPFTRLMSYSSCIWRYLVGGVPTPLKNMKVTWDDHSKYMGK